MDCVKKNISPYQKDVDALEIKVISEFNKFMHSIGKGHRPDYQFIINEINLLNLLKDDEIEQDKFIFILQYFLTNKWKMILS